MIGPITCAWCEHDHDAGDYPDHGEGDPLDCEGCGRRFWIAGVDYDPVFYTTKEEPSATTA